MNIQQLRPYLTHLTGCDKIQDWSYVLELLERTSLERRDATWHRAYRYINLRQSTCSCGLDKLIKLKN